MQSAHAYTQTRLYETTSLARDRVLSALWLLAVSTAAFLPILLFYLFGSDFTRVASESLGYRFPAATTARQRRWRTLQSCQAMAHMNCV